MVEVITKGNVRLARFYMWLNKGNYTPRTPR